MTRIPNKHNTKCITFVTLKLNSDCDTLTVTLFRCAHAAVFRGPFAPGNILFGQEMVDIYLSISEC